MVDFNMAAEKQNKRVKYEVRTKGDGEFEYFVEDTCDDCGFESGFDHLSLRRCKEHAKCCGGYVVRLTEELID